MSHSTHSHSPIYSTTIRPAYEILHLNEVPMAPAGLGPKQGLGAAGLWGAIFQVEKKKDEERRPKKKQQQL